MTTSLQSAIEAEMDIQFALMEEIKLRKPAPLNAVLRNELEKSRHAVRSMHAVIERATEQKIKASVTVGGK